MSSGSSKKSLGKRRARDSDVATPSSARTSASPLSSLSEEEEHTQDDTHKAKKQKRAETRNCPICYEAIPIRLLNAHAALESRRMDEIILAIGSEEAFAHEVEVNPSGRRSAKKARQSISLRANPSDESTKTLQLIKRRRKQRGVKLKEIALQAEDEPPTGTGRRRQGEEIICPVCLQAVGGDDEAVDAHVNTCLLTESHRLEEERAREELARQQHTEEETSGGGTYVGDLPGAGFYRRNQNDVDIEEDIDIDGDDEAQYGRAQFSEGDLLGTESNVQEPTEDDAAVHEEDKSLRDLIAEGKVVKLAEAKAEMEEVMGVADADRVESGIENARQSGDAAALVQALENKVKLLESTRISSSTASLCRICLDPYNEPTVSIGCFHTSCRECWLRCLGSTKLCPICKRITAAAELRKVYL